MSYAEKNWDNKKQKTILSLPRNRFFFMIGAWAAIGGLLGYAVADLQHQLNMVCQMAKKKKKSKKKKKRIWVNAHMVKGYYKSA